MGICVKILGDINPHEVQTRFIKKNQYHPGKSPAHNDQFAAVVVIQAYTPAQPPQ